MASQVSVPVSFPGCFVSVGLVSCTSPWCFPGSPGSHPLALGSEVQTLYRVPSSHPEWDPLSSSHSGSQWGWGLGLNRSDGGAVSCILRQTFSADRSLGWPVFSLSTQIFPPTFCFHAFWRVISCNSYLYSSLGNRFFLLWLHSRFLSLALVFCRLIMIKPQCGFFFLAFILLGILCASWVLICWETLF
jgi:hypothetical protein